MTCIAVRKTGETIEIAADSQTSYGDVGKELSRSKIYKHENIVFGLAGKTKSAGLLNIFMRTHKPSGASENDVLDYIHEFECWAKNKSNDNYSFNDQLVLIIDGNIFRLYEYHIEKIEEYTAIGSGMFLALGALEMNASATIAVKAAIKYDLYCGGEVLCEKINLNKESK